MRLTHSLRTYFWIGSAGTALLGFGTLAAWLLCGTTVASAKVTSINPGHNQTTQSEAIPLNAGQSLRLDSVFDYDFSRSSLVLIDATLASHTAKTVTLSTVLELGDSESGSGIGAWNELGRFVIPETGTWTLHARLRTADNRLHISRGTLELKNGTVDGSGPVQVLFMIAFALGLLGRVFSRTAIGPPEA